MIPGIDTGGGSLDLSSSAKSGASGGVVNPIINIGSPGGTLNSLKLASPATWIILAVAALAGYAVFKKIR